MSAEEGGILVYFVRSLTSSMRINLPTLFFEPKSGECIRVYLDLTF